MTDRIAGLEKDVEFWQRHAQQADTQSIKRMRERDELAAQVAEQELAGRVLLAQYRELEAQGEELQCEVNDWKDTAAQLKAKVKRLEEAHRAIVDEYHHRGNTWATMAAAAMADISLKALEGGE